MLTENGKLTLNGLVFLLETSKNRISGDGARGGISITGEIDKTSKDWLNKLKEKAPIKSGAFKAGWVIIGPVREGTAWKVSIVNDTPHSVAIEGGVIPGNRPWPGLGPNTVMRAGRIWSKQAPKGTINRVLGNPPRYIFVERLAKRIGNILRFQLVGK